MASPITAVTGRALSLTPGARVLQSPLSDESIWKRLKDAGFDEESIKRRDKAALIAYIAKLEAEIFDVQHHMGLVILERKELTSRYEELKASAETTELMHKCDQAAHAFALAEAKKREESLKKALGIKKECIASMEKALHEMRTESAETKVTAECQLAEARKMTEDAQKKFLDAESKLHAAEALQAEDSQYHRVVERKLQEVEAREDDLSRRISIFKADCDAKEKEIGLERQSLSERQKSLQQEHERLLDSQALLNQREEYVASKSQELKQLENMLEASKEKIEKELRALNDEKTNLELTAASLSEREEAVINREALLNKKEQELLVSQEKLASKESVEAQKIIANHESALRTRNSEFEAEMEMKCKSVEDEIEAKRRAWELREVDLSQREDLLLEREHDLEAQSRILLDKEKDNAEKMNALDDKERSLNAAEKDIELKMAVLEKEREEINKMKFDLQKSSDSLEDEKKQVDFAKDKLETLKKETNELSVLEMKLKEEIDVVRAQNLELMAEADRLKAEKGKFEDEWELIEEKREELQKEAQLVAEERAAVSRLLKDERASLRLEKEAMRDQHKRDVESLNCEREEFMNKMVQERSEWFGRIQQEHADFLLGIEMQKRELESSIEKRREEVESYLRDKEKAFELEKINELQHVMSLREKAKKELEQVALEMKKLDDERMQINLDREQRDKEWTVLNTSIEELRGQTQKLEKQRQLLQVEREEISAQIEHLRKLEDLKLALDTMEVDDMQKSKSSWQHFKRQTSVQNADLVSHEKVEGTDNGDILDSPVHKSNAVPSPNSTRFSWLKRCTELIFKNSPEKTLMKSEEKSLTSDHEHARLASPHNLDSSNGYHKQTFKSKEIFGRQHVKHASDEPKVIFEVSRESEIVKGMHAVESEINEDATESTRNSGRKRPVNSPLDDCMDPLHGQREKKKRRQQEIEAVNPSEDVINDCVISTQASVPEDQHETEGGPEDIDFLITDPIVKIPEEICEMTDTDDFSKEKMGCMLNSEVISSLDIVQDGGTNGHTISREMENIVLASGLAVSEMFEKKLTGNAAHGSEKNLSPQDASTKGDLRLEDPFGTKSNNNDNIGRRTRSKLRL